MTTILEEKAIEEICKPQITWLGNGNEAVARAIRQSEKFEDAFWRGRDISAISAKAAELKAASRRKPLLLSRQARWSRPASTRRECLPAPARSPPG
jgi:hypothetical protein